MTQFITIISEIRIKKIDKTDEISFRSIGASARGSASEPSCVAAGSLGVGRGRRGASGGRKRLAEQVPEGEDGAWVANELSDR